MASHNDARMAGMAGQPVAAAGASQIVEPPSGPPRPGAPTLEERASRLLMAGTGATNTSGGTGSHRLHRSGKSSGSFAKVPEDESLADDHVADVRQAEHERPDGSHMDAQAGPFGQGGAERQSTDGGHQTGNQNMHTEDKKEARRRAREEKEMALFEGLHDTGGASTTGGGIYLDGPGSDKNKPASPPTPISTRNKLCILSMDGGGIRGLIAARILSRLEGMLEEKTGAPAQICDYFDLVAGTSTGGLLAVMLTAQGKAEGKAVLTAKGCCNFYSEYGKYIFKSNHWLPPKLRSFCAFQRFQLTLSIITRWYDPWKGQLRQLYRPKYPPHRLEKILKQLLVKDRVPLTLKDVLKPLLITSFDIAKAIPFFFVSQAAKKDEYRNFRGTAAAPTFFPPITVRSVNDEVEATLIDGGTVQNNPTLVALTHALGNNEDFPEASSLKDVFILSLGAGQLDEKLTLQKSEKWGLAGWVRPLMGIMMDGTADTVDYQIGAACAGQQCSENYLRIQVSGLPRKTSLMDCATKANIADLIGVTDDLLKQKAAHRNAFGERVSLDQTYEERLHWLAEQLIKEKKGREEREQSSAFDRRVAEVRSKAEHAGGFQRLDPATRSLVSPLLGHIGENYRSVRAAKAMSFRL
eukprot:SM000134S26971  [mRNA]  locus=s134:387347:391764:- [translate_table: standard]